MTMRTLWLVALVSRGGCAASSPPIPPPVIPPIFDNQILTHRIGPVSLGMTEANLLQYVGAPSKTTTYPDGTTVYEYDSLGMTLTIRQGRVQGIMTVSERYAMPSGVRVGSPEIEVQAKMPAPSSLFVDENTLERPTRYCYPNALSVWNYSGKVKIIGIGGGGC